MCYSHVSFVLRFLHGFDIISYLGACDYGASSINFWCCVLLYLLLVPLRNTCFVAFVFLLFIFGMCARLFYYVSLCYCYASACVYFHGFHKSNIVAQI